MLVEKILKQIAESNPDYLKGRILKAEEKGYFPFIHLGQESFKSLKKNFEPWVVNLISSHLANETISCWIFDFAEVMTKLGKSKCLEAAQRGSLIQTVRKHQLWREVRRRNLPAKAISSKDFLK